MPAMIDWTGSSLAADALNGAPRTFRARVGAKVAAGGEGTVYEDAGRPTHVLKLMHAPDARVQNKIRAMLATAPKQQIERDPDDNSEVIQIAWPQEILLDAKSRFVGFSMRRLDASLTVQILAWFDARARARNKLDQSDLMRLYLAANLASVTAFVNGAGHAIVDFKPQNVQAYRQHGYVCLLDCDGFAIRSGADVFPSAVVTPDYLAPEHHANLVLDRLDELQDRFALAAIIFTLLDNGNHPSTGKSSTLPDARADRVARGAFFLDPGSGLTPPESSHLSFFPDSTLALFRRAFLGAPRDRPSSLEWKTHCQDLIKAHKRCPNHKLHGDYGKGCPWCASASRPQSSSSTISPQRLQHKAPPPSPPPVTRSRIQPLRAPVRPVISGGGTSPGSVNVPASAPNKLKRLWRVAALIACGGVFLYWRYEQSLTGSGRTERPLASIEKTEPDKAPGPVSTFQAKDCDVCPELVRLPAGISMEIGTPESEAGHRDEEGPVRRVSLWRAMAIGRYEVTFNEWDACVQGGGCGGYRPNDPWGRGRNPVINVNWDDAQLYTHWLSRKTGRRYRLPSEAEWEIAARAGSSTPYFTGDTINFSQANFDGTLGSISVMSRAKAVPVGTVGKPNAYRLHDMLGNVWEWVEDCKSPSYAKLPGDGSPDLSGFCEKRGMRGGAWASPRLNLRAGNRNFGLRTERSSRVGFRVVREE